MKRFPYIVVSIAMTLDGYIDDASSTRLVISNQKDKERVKQLRDTCDAILVGANTIRKDNPKLLSGRDEKLVKITLSSSGNLDPNAQFFTTGNSDKFVYTTSKHANNLKKTLFDRASVFDAGEDIDIKFVLEDLYKKGVKRLLVEGGSQVLTQFLQEGLVDELRLAIGGFFVGDNHAPRFVNNGVYPFTTNNRMHLSAVEKLDDIAVLIYKI